MFQSARDFRLWDYVVSHNQLLLRSPVSPDWKTNIDVIFWGVEFLSIPTSFKGLEIRCADTASDSATESRHLPAGRQMILITDRKEYSIKALAYKVFENQLDLFDSSLERFDNSDNCCDRGKILDQL